MKEKTLARVQESPATVIYIGAKIPHIAESNAIYNNGLPKALAQLAEKSESVRKLIIPINEFKNARAELQNPSSVLSHFYKQALNETRGGANV